MSFSACAGLTGSGQVNHTDVISQISTGLNLANEKETIFVCEARTWQGTSGHAHVHAGLLSNRGLLSGEVAAVDEHEFAGVKGDCPPSSRSDKLMFPDLNGMTAHLTEIIDHDSAHFRVRSGVHPHPSTDPNRVCGAVVVAWALGHT